MTDSTRVPDAAGCSRGFAASRAAAWRSRRADRTRPGALAALALLLALAGLVAEIAARSTIGTRPTRRPRRDTARELPALA